MVIVLTGANSFTLGRELHKLTTKFLAEHDAFGLERIDGEEAEFARISEALTSLPFLADKKMIVLRRPSANKQFLEAAEQILSTIPETTDVIIVEPKLDKRLAYYKFLKKQTDFQEFPELDATNVAHWLSGEATKQKGSLSAADARFLIDRVGINQQLLASELEKLLLHEAKITKESIELLTEATPQSTIFELLESAFAGNARRAMQLYAEQRAQKVEAPQIIAMLAWQLHIVALVKTAGKRPAAAIASEAKLSPYVVQKSQAIARQLSLAELKVLLKNLLEIDARSKRENFNADEALQNYLLQLAS